METIVRTFKSPALALPWLKTAEHYLPATQKFPATQKQLWGNGLLFVDTIREATRIGGLWLVMQDSNGQTAMNESDIVTHATISSVDWLSHTQICVELSVDGFGIVAPPADKHRHLSARLTPLWASEHVFCSDEVLKERLKQLWQENNPHCPDSLFKNAHFDDPCWLCFRWLELLPLPLHIKQRLLHHPTPDLCLRYLEIMIQQSDRYAEMLR